MPLGSSKYVAAFDLGTTSARVIIFDEYGSPQAACQRPQGSEQVFLQKRKL